MKKVVGIRFKPTGKVYDFDCGAFVLRQGDHVIVETEKGLGLGTVVVPPSHYDESIAGRLGKPLKEVFRLANQKDFQQMGKNLETEQHTHAYCLKCIKELGLKMNLFSVESSFDASKLTFYFTSENRVDFRQLVKMLVKKSGVRIEMRQIGIRNQAKMCGGIGRCGREICCSAFIEKFGPVSIRMAKEQGLSLNPTKISGQCGRLMCCLTFENEMYQTFKAHFPKIGKTVKTKDGKGKVIRHNAIFNKMTICLDSGQEIEIGIDDIVKEK